MRKFGVNLIGLGSVGSHIGYTLLKMGFTNARGFDPDTVEDQNLGNQMYPDEAVGMKKALAFKAEMKRIGVPSFDAVAEKYEGQPLIPGIVISSVDTMESRRGIWKHLRKNPAVELYLDTRMGLLQGNRFWVNPQQLTSIEWYERYLEGEGVEDPCNARTVVHTCIGIAWGIGSDVARFARKEPLPDPYFLLDTKNLEAIHAKPREGV
jgi:hypothetical protein